MKKILISTMAALCTFSSVSHAEFMNENELECWKDARAALVKKLKKKDSDITFWEGVQMGDGASAFEIYLYFVKQSQNDKLVYKIEFDAEDCSQPISINEAG